VDANISPCSSFSKKFLNICLIESVDNTVEIPILEASKEAIVDFPVPLVPPSIIIIEIFLSLMLNKNLIKVLY